MSRWTIYDKDGNALHESIEKFDGKGKAVEQDTLEYSGKWMGDCFITVSFKSAYPIDFQIGDYIMYRGEKFTINYDPTVIKKSSRGTYGDGFTYDSVKFNALSNELTDAKFHDWVLSDNKIHYSSLPNFSFYAKDMNDLADRLQACTDKWCKDNGFAKENYWIFYTPGSGGDTNPYDRTIQRAKDISTDSTFIQNVLTRWKQIYGDGGTLVARDDERLDKSISVSNQTVWQGMAMFKSQFGLNFIVRGREVIVGSAGVLSSHIFQYGKDKGLYEVQKQADTDQKVVTRLHAYGSSDNLPTRYYAELDMKVSASVTDVDKEKDYMHLTLDMPFKPSMYTQKLSKYGDNIYAIRLTLDGTEINARVEGGDDKGKVKIYSEYLEASEDPDDNTDKSTFDAFYNSVKAGSKVYITGGVNKDLAPAGSIDYSMNALPNNMAVMNLMLPGFPKYALSDICKSEYDTNTDTTSYYIRKSKDSSEWVLFHSEQGKHVVRFSSDQYDPYIVSQNADTLGYKDDDIFCTEENDDNGLKKVYPSVEEITEAEAGVSSSEDYINTIVSADIIKDNGVFSSKTGTTIPGFKVTIKNLGFNLQDAIAAAGGDGCKLSMKDGHCGGRDFDVPSVSKNNDGTWTLNCKRSQDSSLDLYYPYSYNASIGGTPNATESYQICSGDHYVLTGIALEDTNYVWAASVKLLRKAIHWLCKNDYSRYTYSPKIDEIYMARQDEEAKASGGKIKSLHDTLKEGDLLWFKDEDLLLDGKVYIDQLVIKENGNNGIPTYDVTLRNEVQVGTIQRIQNKVDSISNDIRNGNIGGGVNPSTVENITTAVGDTRYLRKDQDDETTHKLTMGEAAVKGDLTLGPNGTYSISKEGVAKLAGVVAEYLKSSNFRPGTAMGFDGQGYGVTKGTDGNYTLEIDNLIARMKMIVAELEVHEMSFIGGTVVMSSCGNRVDRVEALDADGNSIATADSNNPTLTIPSDKTADKFRCYFLASDGDRQIKNEWTVGQLARAKTNNIAAPGNYTDYQNRDYWRLVVGVSAAPVVKEGKQYHYIDLSNSTSKDIVLTDAAGTTSHVTLGGVSETLNSLPFAGDNIIGMGHCLDDTRKNVAILSVDSLGWKLYKGIDHYDLPEENIVNQFSIDKTIVTTDHFVLRPYAAPKETQTVAVVRGPYSDKNDYGHNDLTTLDGQTWIGSGIPIGKTIKGERPSATSPYWSLAAAKGIQGDKGDGYSIAFLLNNVPVDVINFDTVKGMEGSEVTLEADFYNNAVSTNVNKAVITCYDADGNILGSPIEATKADNIVVDGGNLYLSKLCAYITTIAYDAGGKMLVSKSIGVVRNGESVGVKSVTYKVINDVDAGTPLNWDSVTAQTTYPTQKPPKGKYCYVMTIVAYSDGTTTNTVSTSYTPMDGNDGTSVKVTSTKVEYAGSDSGTTPPSSGWQTAVPQLAQGKYLWTRTTVTYSDNNSTTSYSVGRIGIDGRTPIITIGTNGNWLIDGNDSGQKAQGNAGHTPTVTIGPDGYWYIDGVRTSQKAQGDKGDNYSVTFLLNGARVDVLNFDDVRTLTEATFEADFYNQGTTVNIPKATLTCYDKEGNVLGSPIEITNTNNIVADGGNLYLSKDCKTITAVGKDGEKVLFSSSVAVIRSTITYRLIPMSDCSATVKASGTSTSAQFRLSYNLHYKAAKLVGDRAEDATIATIAATIEGKEITTPVNNTEGTLKEDGALNYTSDKRPADSIPVTVTLSDGTVLYDNVPVTMEAGVAIDINQNLGKFSLKVQAMSSVLYAESHQKNDTEDASYATFTPGGGSRVWLATTNGRGTTWFLVRPDGTVYNNVHTYDTYDNASLCDTMATDLYNTRSSSMILVVLSYDATSMTQKLVDELSWWGLDPTAIAPYSGQRNAFAFVGEANLGSGRGWWSLASGSGGKAVVNAMVSNGHVVAQYAGADAAQRRLLLATGVDIKDKKITATADKFVVNNNSGITTFYIDQDGNIVGAGNASFKGTITGSVINGSTIQSSYGAYTTTIQGGSIETNNIVATGGSIGEWTIKDGGLTTAYGSKACIEMRGPKSSFRLDSDNTTNGGSLLDIYNSSGRVISIVSEDSDEAALYIRNNASNRNLAISTFGNNSFLARVGEATTINRFAYACVRTGAVNVDFDDLFVSKETSGNKFPGNVIITTNYSYEQTVKFPSNPALGVQLIVIQGTNQKVHFDGNGHRFQQGSDVNSSANSAQNGQWNLFIFDGQYWQCIYITGHLLW